MRVTTLVLTTCPTDVMVGAWELVEGGLIGFREACKGVKGDAGVAYAVELGVEVETGILARLLPIRR